MNSPFARLKGLLSFLFVALLSFNILMGCATYQDHVSKARNNLRDGNIEEALEELKKRADKKSDDQLVYLLDYATALQYAGRIDESIQYFLTAEQLAEELDYHSVSRVTGSMLLNEEMIQYKGDTFEKVFINAFLALNFLKKNDLDSAMVEVRKMNQKFNKYQMEEKKAFEVNPFSRYLAAMIYEADQKWDDAYIAYNEAYKIAPDIPRLRSDLIRSSHFARRPDEHKRWRNKFPEVDFNPQDYNLKKEGRLTVIHLQGWGPRKRPDPQAPLMPMLVGVSNETQVAQVMVDGRPLATTELVYNTQEAAIKTLMADRPALIARRVAAQVAREAAARAAGKDDSTGAAATIAFLAMQVTERADLRQWSFLPASVQVAQASLAPGEYDVAIIGMNGEKNPSGERSESIRAKIKPGTTQFLIWRSIK